MDKNICFIFQFMLESFFFVDDICIFLHMHAAYVSN